MARPRHERESYEEENHEMKLSLSLFLSLKRVGDIFKNHRRRPSHRNGSIHYFVNVCRSLI